MNAIWKYPLGIADVQTVKMPAHAKILCAQMQGGDICLWAVVNPEAELTPRNIEVFETGNQMDDGGREYIGTVQSPSFARVWHVFERV